MREIKFRGMKPSGEWIYGNYCQTIINEKVIHCISKKINENIIHIAVDPETISQSTGLIDKNEKEIYENDYVIEIFIHFYEGIITWWDSGWFIKTKNHGMISLITSTDGADEIKIIGNKWENPELF